VRTALVIEDDYKTADTVSLYLRHGGFRVTVAHDGSRGLELATRESFDLVVLDRMLPGVDGVELCRRLRRDSNAPVIMLTAMVEEEDRLEGFQAGVDDYVTKPFSPRELLARAEAVLRRTGLREGHRRSLIRVGRLALDPAGHTAWLGERELELSPTEFRLLQAMAAAPGKVFERQELADRALPEGGAPDLRTVDAHIKNLRRKLDSADGPSCIVTVFGIGYRLSAEACRGA